LGVHPGKIASFLAQLCKEFELKGLSVEEAYDIIIDLSEIAVSKNVPLPQLASELKKEYEQLDLIREDVDYNETVRLEAIRQMELMVRNQMLTEEQLTKFCKLYDIFEEYYNRVQAESNPIIEEEPTYLYGERIDRKATKRKPDPYYP
jgi:hypothetical protein